MSIMMILSLLIAPTNLEAAEAKPVDRIKLEVDEVMDIAKEYNPKREVALAIVLASRAYGVDRRKLAAIAIIETSFGSNIKTQVNSNGSVDIGLFQINTINRDKCLDISLDTLQGSALCAARLLADLKSRRPGDWYGAYHSKTPSRKLKYMDKIHNIIGVERNVASFN